MYETMAGWETMDTGPDQSAVMRDFARLWREADKVVFSSTLAEPSTARTRIVPAFDPAAVRDLKSSTAGGLNIGGPTLAAHAFRAGLVDECHLFLHPVAVGGGKAALPPGMRIDLDLEDERRFAGGVVYLRYRVRPASTPPGGA
jgi:dihydrofolate reductase